MSGKSGQDLEDWSVVHSQFQDNDAPGITSSPDYEELTNNLKSLELDGSEMEIYEAVWTKIQRSFGDLLFDHTNLGAGYNRLCSEVLSKEQISKWRDQRIIDRGALRDVTTALNSSVKDIKSFYTAIKEDYDWTDPHFEDKLYQRQKSALKDIGHRFERDPQGQIALTLDCSKMREDLIRLQTEAQNKSSTEISEKPIIAFNSCEKLSIRGAGRPNLSIDGSATSRSGPGDLRRNIDDLKQKAIERTEWSSRMPLVGCEDPESLELLFEAEMRYMPEVAERLTRWEALVDLSGSDLLIRSKAFEHWFEKHKKPRRDRAQLKDQYEKENRDFFMEMSKIDRSEVVSTVKDKVHTDISNRLENALLQRKEKGLIGIGSLDDLWIDKGFDASKFDTEVYEPLDWPPQKNVEGSSADEKQQEPLYLTTINNGWYTYQIKCEPNDFLEGIDQPEARNLSDFIDINDPKYLRPKPSVSA